MDPDQLGKWFHQYRQEINGSAVKGKAITVNSGTEGTDKSLRNGRYDMKEGCRADERKCREIYALIARLKIL